MVPPPRPHSNLLIVTRFLTFLDATRAAVGPSQQRFERAEPSPVPLRLIGEEHEMAETKETVPTAKMAANAKRGLALREAFSRGGTEVGVGRAHQLADRKPLTEADIKSMYSYFARHAVDKQTHSHSWGDDTDPSAGYIAWLLWGGDEGKTWVDRRHAALED